MKYINIILNEKDEIFRSNIIESINLGHLNKRGFKKPISLIIAPAGYGKTTLIKQWIETLNKPFILGMLNENCNEGSFFLHQLISSGKKRFENYFKLPEALLKEELKKPTKEKFYEIIDSIINDLIEIEEDLYLIIEDYHYINNLDIHDAVVYFVNNLPSNVHIILSTRFTPPFPIIKWQSKNEVNIIDSDKLKFDEEEIKAYVTKLYNLSLSDKELSLLKEKSEGWVTAINLFLIGFEDFKGGNDISDYLLKLRGNEDKVLEYITEEFFFNLDEKTKELLIKSSVLNYFSKEILEDIFEINYENYPIYTMKKYKIFISSLDIENKFYSYNYLLLRLLRSKLKDYPVSERDNLRKMVMDYFEKKDFLEVINQGMQLEDDDYLGKKLEDNWNYLIESNGSLKSVNAVNFLRESTLEKYPILMLMKTFLILVLTGKTGAKYYLELGENLGYEDEERDNLYKGILDVLNCYYLIYENELERAMVYANKGIKSFSQQQWFWSMSLNVMLGDIMTFSGNLREGYYYYNKAHHINKLEEKSFFILSTSIKLSYILAKLGDLKEGEKILAEMDLLMKKESIYRSSKAGALWVQYALLLYEKNERELSTGFMNKALILTKGDKLYYAWALLGDLKILINDEDFKKAQERVNEILAIDNKYNLPYYIGFQTRIYQGYIYGMLGFKEKANQTFNLYKIQYDNFHSSMALGYLMKLKLDIINRNLRKKDIINKIFFIGEKLKEMEHMEYYYDLMIYKFKHVIDKNDLKESELEFYSSLSKQLQEKGFKRYESIINDSIGTKETLEESGGKLKSKDLDKNGKDELGSLTYVEPLSKREKEVLNLIADGMSNKKICEKLYLSLSTVKWHVSNIYSKLGVKRRTEAVALGRKLNII